MTNLEDIKLAMQEFGAKKAAELQEKVDTMTSTEMYEEIDSFPLFPVTIKVKNMQERPIGFTVRTSEGRVAQLVENYDSSVVEDEPEYAPLYWKLRYSTNPAHAKNYVAVGGSAYMKDECCVDNSVIYASTIDDNTNAPSASIDGWKIVGTVINGKYTIY